MFRNSNTSMNFELFLVKRADWKVDSSDHQLDVPTANYGTEKMALSTQIYRDILEKFCSYDY
jgi:hypothetical protein